MCFQIEFKPVNCEAVSQVLDKKLTSEFSETNEKADTCNEEMKN